MSATCAACLAAIGCDRVTRSTSQNSIAPPTTSPPVTPAAPLPAYGRGHPYGNVTIGDDVFLFEGILADDGVVRMHIGGSLEQESSSQGAMQFIGEIDADRAVASGVVVSEDCAGPVQGRFCSAPAAAELTLDGDRDELRVTTIAGEEAWALETVWWDPSYLWGASADVSSLSGLWRATLAEFVVGSDTIIEIDGQGRLFFQSPNSGCVGNGTLTPHGNGLRPVYDIALTIANCGPDYAGWNGEFAGLVTDFVWTPWDYDRSGLIMWLSVADQGAAPFAAMTIRAQWL